MRLEAQPQAVRCGLIDIENTDRQGTRIWSTGADADANEAGAPLGGSSSPL